MHEQVYSDLQAELFELMEVPELPRPFCAIPLRFVNYAPLDGLQELSILQEEVFHTSQIHLQVCIPFQQQ